MHLQGKRALVMGGSKGIDRASADLLVAEGCDLLLVACDPAGLEAAATVRAKRQVRMEVMPAGLSRQTEVE